MNDHSPSGQEGYGALDILEASQDCAWILRPDGSVEHMNQRARSLLAVEAGDISAWRENWPEESRSSLDRAFTLALTGQVARFRAFMGSALRSRVYCATTLSPMRAPDGAVIRLLVVARDVTREVETEAFLKTVIQLLPSPLTVKTIEDGRYVLINRAAEDAFDIVADEALGKRTRDVFDEALTARLSEREALVLSSGEMQVGEEIVRNGPDGAQRCYLTKTLATYDDAGPRHMVTLGEDVTAQRAAAASLREALDQAEQASRAKSAFLANMSHEIRTPLNGIVAGADLLARGDLSPRERELADIILTSGQSLERLLSDVLDLARIEAGQVAVETTPFHLGDMARSIAALCALRADEKGVALFTHVSPAAETHVLGDSDRLRQVLTNLLSNAAKFTDEGEVTLDVTLDSDGAAYFTVSDTGIGFDAAQKDRIFDRFQQVDASFTRRFGGSGLGLAISRELVELMGGALSCDSTPGVGSTFWFNLPLPIHQQPAASETLEIEEPATSSAPRVLVVDDHPINRKLVELILAGHAEVFTAENGQEAVETYEMATPDLVLMDMQMPVMDGLTAVRKIRALEATGGRRRTPIIMLTANARPEHVNASREAGADLHLEKPITSAMLFAAITQAFEAVTVHATDKAAVHG